MHPDLDNDRLAGSEERKQIKTASARTVTRMSDVTLAAPTGRMARPLRGRRSSTRAGLAALALMGCEAPPSSLDVHVWMTTPDGPARLARQSDVHPRPGGAASVAFDENTPLQAIDGFGAAFTDSSASLLWKGLDPAARARVMRDLFGRPDGIGLAFMRIPMGASDFTACACSYSYDDAPGGDPTLASFSTAVDDGYVLPVIREALAVAPGLKLVANPWSPPAWMKTNGSMLGTTGGQTGTLRDGAAAPLAQYFAHFLLDYRSKGVPVWAVTPQNEPSIAPDSYPGMYLSPDAEAGFIADALAPALQAAGLSDVKILGGDDTGAYPSFAQTLWSSPAAAALGGTAWHCYGGLDGMSAMHDQHPEQPLYVTECSTGPTGIAGETTPQVMAALANWASGVLLWNLALDPNGQPKQGHGCDGCTGLVTIDPAAGTATATINHDELGQFSKFIAPGAHRLAATATPGGGGVTALGFLNPDGTLAVVAFNPGASPAPVTIAWRAQGTFDFTVPAGATVTFTDGAW